MTFVICGRCGVRIRVVDGSPGRRVRCGRCRGVTTIPGTPPSDAPATPSSTWVPATAARPTRPAPERKPGRRFPDPEPWLSLAIGAALAFVAFRVPAVEAAPAILHVVIHELGHVGTDWVTGGASVPGFDLANGGGFFRSIGRLPALLAIIYAVFAYILFRVRDRPRLFVACLVGVALHVLVTFTRLRDFLIVTMGHGLGLIVAGIFLYRALCGVQILRGVERPLYAFLGIYLLVFDFQFASALRNDIEAREAYAGELRDGYHHDLVRAADEFLHISLEAVATWYMALCVLTPVAAFFAFWLRMRLLDRR